MAVLGITVALRGRQCLVPALHVSLVGRFGNRLLIGSLDHLGLLHQDLSAFRDRSEMIDSVKFVLVVVGDQ